jgi:hypothetical protein
LASGPRREIGLEEGADPAQHLHPYVALDEKIPPDPNDLVCIFRHYQDASAPLAQPRRHCQ